MLKKCEKLFQGKSYSHFFSKKFQHICVSLDVNFNKSLNNDIIRFEQLGPGVTLEGDLGEKVSLSWLTSPYLPVPLSSLSFFSSTIYTISFPPFSGRRHKMTHKGWRVVKPQLNQTLSWAEGEVKLYRIHSEIQNLDQNFSLKSWNCCKTSPSLKVVRWPLWAQGFCSPFIHSLVPNDPVSGQWRPWSDCMDAQADLGHRCSHMPDDTFLHGAAHFSMKTSVYTLKHLSEMQWDWSWNHFYSHSLPSTDSRRAVVSYWQKYVHKYWLTA